LLEADSSPRLPCPFRAFTTNPTAVLQRVHAPQCPGSPPERSCTLQRLRRTGTFLRGGYANSHRSPLPAFRRSQRASPLKGLPIHLPDMFQPGTLLSFCLQGLDPPRNAESSPIRSSLAVSDSEMRTPRCRPASKVCSS
jgi:hypothetical protein